LRIAFLILCCVPAQLTAQTTRWTITTADFQSRQVDLETIDDAGVRVRDKESDPPRVVPWGDLLALDRQTESRTPFFAKLTVLLTTGDQIRGEPVKIEGETLTWNAASLGQLQFPLQQIKAITRGPQQSPSRDGERITEDVVTLANGDTVRGIISGLADKQLTVQAGGNATPVPLDSINSVQFASTALPSPAASGRAVRVKLSDDSLITAQSVKTTADELTVTLAGVSRRIPLSNLAALEQINGPVSFLSSRPPTENLHTPLLETSRPARMDKTVSGQPIRYGDRTYARGIGVAPQSRITFPLPGVTGKEGYQTFRTRYAIDGNAPYADVTIRILLDKTVVHEKKNFAAGQLSPVVLVPLGNAKSLTLEVDFGGNYNVQDRLNWIEPALVKGSAMAPAPGASTRSAQ
jgi:hypothetical protein